ncbi:hypothetical protein FHR94_002081 [Halomonas cerina]|uniref:Uncharacterized protein n=1 Tax=Halomonas cerina TaxID=447424 RepID=A0A839VA55_9GAMM|nr:hypothetical protein [Halomonas cerina]
MSFIVNNRIYVTPDFEDEFEVVEGTVARGRAEWEHP